MVEYYSNTLIVGMLLTRSFERESQCIVIVIVTEIHNLCHACGYIHFMVRLEIGRGIP